MIIKLIQNRRSVFSFSKKVIEQEKVNELFEAAHLAPSSMNIQPWRFIYAAKDDPEFNLFLDALLESNRNWAKEAAILILSFAQMEYIHNEKIFQNKYAWHDTGLANSLLMIQAASMGLVTHPMGGFDGRKAKINFSIPQQFEPIAIIAVGYPGDGSMLSDELLKRQAAPRIRKSIYEVAMRAKDHGEIK